jgi:hypothetical protein
MSGRPKLTERVDSARAIETGPQMTTRVGAKKRSAPSTASQAGAVSNDRGLRIAVMAPCHNERRAIEAVIGDFKRALPSALVYVFDNNSDDGTGEAASAAGAIVRRVALRGKGNVVRRMFADIEADVYVLVDGDDTYEAEAAPGMVAKLVDEGLDMVCGARVSEEQAAFRSGHRLGNRLLNGLVHWIFGRQFVDMLTGYRVMSRRFVKSFPAHSSGFETETELAVHALQMRLPTDEAPTAYRARPEGSESKLNTFRDGWRILRFIGLLAREERPLQFFSATAAGALMVSAVLMVPIILDYIAVGTVPRFPTLIVSVGFAVVGVLSFACGVILDSVSRARLEQRRLAYLAMPGPGSAG